MASLVKDNKPLTIQGISSFKLQSNLKQVMQICEEKAKILNHHGHFGFPQP